MERSKQRELLKELIIHQLAKSKVEPLEAVKLLRFVNRLNEEKINIIVHERIEKIEKLLAKIIKSSKNKGKINLNKKLEDLGKNQDKWYPRSNYRHKTKI